MPRKVKQSKNGPSRVASSQGHSTYVVPQLRPSKLAQPAIPHKAKCSNKRIRHATSKLMSHASSQGHSTLVVPSLQPSKEAESYAPTITIIPPSVPTAQNTVLTSDPPSHKMPQNVKYSNKRVCHGTSNSVPCASSQGHSAPMEPQQKFSKTARTFAPVTFIPPSNPTSQNLVLQSDAPSLRPRKGKFSRERAALGISNLMPQASSCGHSIYAEPQLQPALVEKSSAPTITHVPPSVPTTRILVSPFDPPLHKMPRKAKHSKKKGSRDISSLTPHSSSQGNSTYVELPLQPSLASQSRAPAYSTAIPQSIPTAQNPVSASDQQLHSVSPENVFSSILNLMHHESCQGHSIPTELLPKPLKLAQPSAPSTTDIPPSISTAQDMVSPSNIPSCSTRKSKRSTKGVSHGMPNLMPHAFSQGYSIPSELLVLPSKLALSHASPASLRVTKDPVSSSDPQSSPATQDPVSASDPSSIPVTQDPVSPSDSSSHSTSDTFVHPYTLTQQPHVSHYRPFRGWQWNVQTVDEHGNTKEIQVTKPGVFEMPPGKRIVVPFDGQLRAYGEAATLLSGACGRIATDSKNIPINFDTRPKVPRSYKDDCFNILKTIFHFQASESVARRYCLLTLSRKYRNGKLKLWTDIFDPALSREQLIAKVPFGIPNDQWLSFIDNHLKPEYQELCRKNAEARQMQTVPHTSGAKLLSRKQHEMEVELGRSVSRVELYLSTHKKRDGSYVNEEARTIGEKLTQEISKCANSTEIANNDALAKVLGLDHSGRVRCLGLGGLHSVAFQSSARFGDVAESCRLKEEVVSLKTKLAVSEENVKPLQNIVLTYIQMKEGHIPAELGALLDTTNQVDESSG